MTYDFLSVGDITIDAFIELNQHETRVERDENGAERLSMMLGEKIPYTNYEIVPAVGNAANAAVAASRLGLKSALVTNIGVDRNGKDCLEVLRKEGVHTTFVKQHEDKKTNYHFVLRYGAERTILIKHEHYPYTFPPIPKPPRFLYFSSIGENGSNIHHDIAAYVAQNKEIKLVFQPGTHQLRLGYKPLKDLYAVTYLFVCNKGEAEQLVGEHGDIHELLSAIQKQGPKIVIITDGTRGAYARDEDGSLWFISAYPDTKPPVDRTGAGDAFTATVAAALALGYPLHEAIRFGPINSMNVVQYIGAQKGLLTRKALEQKLTEAPLWYKTKKL